MVTLRQLRPAWTARLEEAGVFAPAFELCELLSQALGQSRERQLAAQDDPLDPAAVEEARRLLERRCAGEPLQYILGRWEFYGLEFAVGEGALIPRPDTETLVEAGLELCAGLERPRAADLCSGTGCVAVALAKSRPDAEVTAVELSEAAFAYLRRNVALHRAANVRPLRADVLGPPPFGEGELHLVLANPPYIRTGELDGLQREVRREPRMALDGGGDGLRFYRAIAAGYRRCLRPGGWLAFEAGDDKGAQVREILRQNGYRNLAARRDLEGFERVILGQKGMDG